MWHGCWVAAVFFFSFAAVLRSCQRVFSVALTRAPCCLHADTDLLVGWEDSYGAAEI